MEKEAKEREKEGKFADILTKSPMGRSDPTTSYFGHSNRRLTDLTVYEESDAYNDNKIEIEEEITHKKESENSASNQIKDTFTVEDINKGKVTSWALYQFHEQCQEYMREQLEKVDHISSVKVNDIGLEIVQPEDISKYIKKIHNKRYKYRYRYTCRFNYSYSKHGKCFKVKHKFQKKRRKFPQLYG
jgi:hypothetical protein